MAFIVRSLLSRFRQDTHDALEPLCDVSLNTREVNLEFFDDSHPTYLTEKPYYSNVPFTQTNAPNTNVVSKMHRVIMHDIRGNEHLFQLDTHGFELLNRPSTFTDWQDGRKVVREVYPQIDNLLKQHLGDNVKVVVFDHTLRRSPSTGRDVGVSSELQSGVDFAPPSRVAHVDQTYKATVDQIKRDFGEDSSNILNGRFRIINIWRPIQGPVKQHPFALCDYRTCKSDFNPCDLVYPHTTTEIMVFRASHSQKWYFIEHQTCDELWLFKIMDSQSAVDPQVAEFSAHTSFFDEDEAIVGCKRESVEFRAYVFG